MAPARPRCAPARPSRPLRLQSVHYRGFALQQQTDLSWSVQPMTQAPPSQEFTAPPSSLADVQALIDWRLGLPV